MSKANANRDEWRPELVKIISGGQTGADRAALEAAQSVGLTTGGTAPPGFRTLVLGGVDLELRDKFGLVEFVPLPSESCAHSAQALARRSRINVESSDITIAFRLQSSIGTDRTVGYCRTRKWCYMRDKSVLMRAALATDHRPCLVIANIDDRADVAAKVAAFIVLHRARTVNVCGHRDDVSAGVTDFGKQARQILERAFRVLLEHAPVGSLGASASCTAGAPVADQELTKEKEK